MEPTRERRAAHERLSTGGLARWSRACATHPWRVVLGFFATIAVLIALVATVGGGLRDEFEIPGSDTQKATDLIEAEFASEQGGVLNLVFAAPEGERLDTPERKAAVEQAIARLKSSEFKPTDDKVGLESVGNPFSKDTFSDDGRIALCRSAVQRGHLRKGSRGSAVPFRMPSRETVEPAGVIVEFNGDAEFPPIEQGTQETARPARGADRAPHRLPHIRGDADPDRAGAHGACYRVPLAVHPRRPHRRSTRSRLCSCR